jgi:dTDP-4-dehydrorhamnose 3,5-epimerase
LIFRETKLQGAYIIELERLEDERGFFARTWCRNEFAAHGIPVEIVQASISQNKRAGTVRGLHFSWPPSHEAKLVRCGRGKIHDVILDLRPDSESFGTHFAVTLDSKQANALFIPPGIAHGFQTLEDDCEVVYTMTDFYRPELAAGVRFDDPTFNIDWPLPVSLIVERDRTYPDFDSVEHALRYRLAEANKDD